METVENTNPEKRNKILSDKDMRLDKELKDYRFRYRPIKRGGNTILHYAMIYGNKIIVEKLLDLKAG